MKQCISLEQFESLDDKKIEQILCILYYEDYDEFKVDREYGNKKWDESTFRFTFRKNFEDGVIRENYLYLNSIITSKITIGKMIEILNNDYGYVEILKEQNEADGVVWWATCNRNEYYDYELVDALWQALCYVLEGEDERD